MGRSKAGIDYIRDEHRRLATSVAAYIENRGGRPRARYCLNGEKKLYLANAEANLAIRSWSVDEAREDILSWELTFAPGPKHLRRPPRSSKVILKPQNRLTKIEDRTYYAPSHINNPKTVVRHAWSRADGKRMNVLYRLNGDRKIFKSPRVLTAWLDGLSLDKIKDELERWIKRENGWDDSLEKAFSETYLEHRVRFLKWLSADGRVQSGTLATYEMQLARYVFPFFRKFRLKENQWGENLGKWSQWLALQGIEAETRNRVRTAVRRWLKYGIYFGLWTTAVPADERVSKTKDKRPIPFDYLPKHDEVLAVIKALPPSRERWLLAMVMGFGVRVSEALAMTSANLLGKTQIASDSHRTTVASNYVVRHGKGAYKPFLMMDVNERVREGNSEIALIVKQEDDTEPKSGPYVAVCLDIETAKFIQQLVKNKEFELPEPNSLYDVFDDLPDGYDSWRYHHFRKWHETWVGLGWGAEDAAQSHGHSRVVATKRYIQWALTRLRGGGGEEIELIADETSP